MSISNVIDLQVGATSRSMIPARRCFASTRETLQLLQAFCAIESALVRAEIIRTAHAAASLGCVKKPPRNSAWARRTPRHRGRDPRQESVRPFAFLRRLFLRRRKGG
jgi:hypothetical protein